MYMNPRDIGHLLFHCNAYAHPPAVPSFILARDGMIEAFLSSSIARSKQLQSF